MSVSREALAEAIGTQTDAVRCDNCIYHSWVAAGLTTCSNYGWMIVQRDSFCSFFEEVEE